MSKDYLKLKLTREELLLAAGYHRKQAVYGIMKDHGAEKTAREDAPSQVEH
jgi:hypothetical protein